jgi:tetratricopeptide (TPR) repeat protein
MVFAFLILLINLPSIVNGDRAFEQLHYQEALALYQEGLQKNPDDANLLWRMARIYVSMGDVAKRDEREPYYRKADSCSLRAVSADSLNSDAHCWKAITVGYVSMYEGVRSKVKMANVVKSELDEAIRLNPGNDVAYSILGTFYRAIGNISWIERQLANLLLGGIPAGGFEEGEQALKKAIELAPNIIRHRYELGRLYLDWGKDDLAKKVFAETVDLPPTLASDERRIEFMKKKLSEKQ